MFLLDLVPEDFGHRLLNCKRERCVEERPVSTDLRLSRHALRRLDYRTARLDDLGIIWLSLNPWI
jgi:hypothetical protein